MTNRTATVARGRRDFRRWRHGRPFWGGLLLLLSGVEIFLSGNLSLGALTLKVGQQGFLPYLIPIVLVLCGVLVWLSPQQRLFYGIVGSLVALYSLVGVNLGGFIVGTTLGILGGGFTVAWTPLPPPAVEGPGGSVDPGGSSGAESHEPDGVDSSGAPPSELPPKPGSRMLAIALIPATLAAGALFAVRPGVAHAETCPSTVTSPSRSASARPATSRTSSKPAPPPPAQAPPPAQPGGAGAAPGPGATTAAPAKAPAAPPAAGANGGNWFTDAISGIVNGIARLFGGGSHPASGDEPAPSASPSQSSPAPPPGPVAAPPAPPAAPPARPAPPVKSSSPRPSSSIAFPPPGTCGPARVLAVDPEQPFVNAVPSLMLADRLTMKGLSFDGVVPLPTKTGPIRVLRFSMDESVSTPFELRVPVSGNRVLSLKSDKLTVSKRVLFYTDRFEGNVFGLIPMTFTPDSPPPLILSKLEFTKARIQLVYVQCDVLTATNLHISEASAG